MKLWAFEILGVTRPTKPLGLRTFLKLLILHKPNLSKLQVFDILIHVHATKRLWEKIIKEFHEKIFLGINDSTNTYTYVLHSFSNEGKCAKIWGWEKIQKM
jgi:hypothetical protein